MINRNSWYDNVDFLYIIIGLADRNQTPIDHHDKLAVYFKHIKPFQTHIVHYTLHGSSKAYLDQS